MVMAPHTIVPAPEPRGLRYGLLTAANGPLDLPAPAGHGGGVQYEPVSCGFARLYPVDCDDDPPEKTFDPADPWVTADPLVAYATLTCSAVGSTAQSLEAKVARRLANGEQSIAEQALDAVLSTAGGPTLTAPDPTRIKSVIGELEQWLYGPDGANYGNVGYLHAPFRYAQVADPVADGRLLRTKLGSIWVFGAYPDDGTIRISGQVTVWRAPEVFVSPAGQGFDRASNTYRLLAEREYAVAFDCVTAEASYQEGTP
ncbi:hypothetical protein [Micromonospora sp. WMMC273]|uniref:hypothetical protein n=1 Tax=Micromonospora sp. WMMC273 TaxID=3015157 RepID=UPI0022B6F31D|nr:hypothetical protein [Micromonospora sp. WMMC273]MCZ7478888.1 hypothetical protein [Micromonospora sp. WMMC273]